MAKSWPAPFSPLGGVVSPRGTPLFPLRPARRASPLAGRGFFVRDYGNCLHFRPVFPCSRAQIPPQNHPVFRNLALCFSVISHPRSFLLPHHAPRRRRAEHQRLSQTERVRLTMPAGGWREPFRNGEESRRRRGKRRAERAGRRKRCDATRSGGAGGASTKCEITGTARHDGGPPSHHRLPRLTPSVDFWPPFSPPGLPLLSDLCPPVSPLAPPLLPDFWPSSLPRPARMASPPARGGIFRARLRKLLAFLRRFSVFSHPNFAPKSLVFP